MIEFHEQLTFLDYLVEVLDYMPPTCKNIKYHEHCIEASDQTGHSILSYLERSDVRGPMTLNPHCTHVMTSSGHTRHA